MEFPLLPNGSINKSGPKEQQFFGITFSLRYSLSIFSTYFLGFTLKKNHLRSSGMQSEHHYPFVDSNWIIIFFSDHTRSVQCINFRTASGSLLRVDSIRCSSPSSLAKSRVLMVSQLLSSKSSGQSVGR